jgi:hypothetical protein
MKKDALLVWRVNTPGLLREIGSNNAMSVMSKPLMIFARILGEVATRASQLNDPKMNALMARLALYEITNPESKEFDREKTEQLINMSYKKDK